MEKKQNDWRIIHMKKELEIKVNVINQLKLLRQSTFKDPLSLLDEIIQNAQRAGAKNAYVMYSNNRLTVENDGDILENPQILFSMGDSGWKKDVIEKEKPFGMGFFSVITASDYIEIFSGNQHVIFNVKKIIEENEIGITVEETEDFYDGFKLILHNFSLEDIYYWDIEERTKQLGKYIQELDVYYDGKKVEKKPLTEGEGLPFETPLEEDNFIGWIGLKEEWYGCGLKIFYQGRFVTKLDSFPHVVGEIHVNHNVLTLQSPDRKDIIRDEKLQAFKNEIRSKIESLVEISILSGNDKDIQVYEDAFQKYVNADTIRYRLPFSVFSGKTKKDISYLEGIAIAMKNDKQFATIGEYEVYLRKLEEEKAKDEISFSLSLEQEQPQGEEQIVNETEENSAHEEENNYEEEEEHEEEVQKEISYPYPVAPSSAPASVIKKERKQEEKKVEVKKEEPKFPSKKMYLTAENENPTFWVKLDELTQYQKRIGLIQEYGIELIVAQNKIEENVLLKSSSQNIHHIKDLVEKVTIQSSISSIQLSPKEQRANMIFDMISRMYGFDENLFQIGNVMVTKLIDVPQIDVHLERIEEDITVVANTKEQKIFIDRTIVENSMLSPHTDEEIEVSDYKFILLHLKNIVDQVKTLGFMKEDELYDKTFNALCIA